MANKSFRRRPSIRVQLSARICVEASTPVALARHELGPLLLGVNDCEALKLLPRFVGDHFVEGPFDFGTICHTLLSPGATSERFADSRGSAREYLLPNRKATQQRRNK